MKNMPGIESKSVTCPVCKHKHPFTEFKKVTHTSEEEEPTDYEYTDYKTSGHASSGPDFTLGILREDASGKVHHLRPGRNVIGRAAAKSGADIRLETGGSKRMSREHLVIDVKKDSEKGYVHYASLFKDGMNDTFINDEKLYFGDTVILHDKMRVDLPDFTVYFRIPDEEATDYGT